MTRLEAFYAARDRYRALRDALTTPAAAGARAQQRYFNRETYLVPEWPMPEAPSPDGAAFASLLDREIFVRGGTGGIRALTHGATDDTGWDLETTGASPWSPDGQLLFACAADRRNVVRSARTRFDPDGQVDVDWPRSQRAGTPIDIMAPHLVPIGGGEPIPIDIGDTRDSFIRLAGWTPDGKAVVFLRFARLLDRADLFLADRTGKARRIMSESAPTFLRQSSVIWTEPPGCWIIDEAHYLWLSTSDGWTHLYLGTFGGGEPSPLTRGAFVVHDVPRWDDEHVWFTASEDGARPYDRHLYRVARTGGPAERLTDGEGVHEIAFSEDGTRFTDRWSSPGRRPSTTMRGLDGTTMEDARSLDLGKLFEAGWRAPEELSLLAADGATMLHGVLFPPQGLEEGKRYPLIHWLYGGPQIASTPRRFGPRDDTQVLLHSMTEMGYGVFVIDARGTPGRSKAFADVVWRSFAPHVVADQIAALRQAMAARPWIDPGRIGVMGRSWGAHFALRLLAGAPDLYRGAALVVPGLDPYGGLIYEPYLGLPETEPDVYRAAEPWSCVEQLSPDARLLLMAGTLDSPCQWDLQRLSTLLVAADIGHHALTFAEEEHMFMGAAHRFHDRAILEFFDAVLA